MFQFIDTHAHINFNAYKDDGDEVIRRALAEEVAMILVGSDYKTSKRALDYANKYEKGVWAAVGLHPMQIFSFRAKTDDYDFQTRGEDFNYDSYDKLTEFERVVAIGEIGLDYYHLDPASDIAFIKEKQKEVFRAQLLLARRTGKPVIIHCRQAHDDMVEILKDFKKVHKEMFSANQPWGVMHCFSGDENLAWTYFDLGLLLSFTGLITFSNQWDDLIRKLPLGKIMIETDAPFLTPEPFRGQRNEPLLVKKGAERIAQIKNIATTKVAAETTANARNLFKI